MTALTDRPPLAASTTSPARLQKTLLLWHVVIIGLASLIIGETLFGRGGMWVKAVAAVAGSVIYRFIIALALRANVPSECLKLISAVIVALAIAAPALKAKADFRRRRANAQKGGARHA